MWSSWMPKVLGIIVLIGDAANLITVTIEKSGIPTNATQWIYTLSGLATGIGLIVAKQWDVSNSPTPVAAAVVSPASGAKANPAATK